MAIVGDPLPGRCTVRVRQRLRARDYIRLPFVDLRHGALAAAEPLLDSIADFLTENEFTAQGVGHRLTRHIVFGGAEAAGQNHDSGVAQGGLHGVGEQRTIVADDQLPAHLDAERI